MWKTMGKWWVKWRMEWRWLNKGLQVPQPWVTTPPAPQSGTVWQTHDTIIYLVAMRYGLLDILVHTSTSIPLPNMRKPPPSSIHHLQGQFIFNLTSLLANLKYTRKLLITIINPCISCWYDGKSIGQRASQLRQLLLLHPNWVFTTSRTLRVCLQLLSLG